MCPRKPVATWVTQSQQTLETLIGPTKRSWKNLISRNGISVSCSRKTTKRNDVTNFRFRFLKPILKSSGSHLRHGKYLLRKSKQPWFISTSTYKQFCKQSRMSWNHLCEKLHPKRLIDFDENFKGKMNVKAIDNINRFNFISRYI